jgi:hypothetical protein
MVYVTKGIGLTTPSVKGLTLIEDYHYLDRSLPFSFNELWEAFEPVLNGFQSVSMCISCCRNLDLWVFVTAQIWDAPLVQNVTDDEPDFWVLGTRSIGEGSCKEVETTKDMLDSNKCCLLDCGSEFFIWMGRNTSLDARKIAITTAEVSYLYLEVPAPKII